MQEKELIEDMNRPWGGYKVFTDNEKCTTKILFIKKGAKLSVQSHKKRDEFWYIISGQIRVYRGEVKKNIEEIKKSLKTYELSSGDNICIPKETVHSIENIGDEDAKVLEIMTGEWDENDIIRYEDIYGRNLIF